MTNNEQKVHKLFEKIMLVESVHNHSGKLIEYAQTYAQAAIINEMTGNMLRVQVLYVLGNLGGWHGKEARETKAQLNRLVKKL